MELTAGVNSLWIYSNIVAPQMVANRTVPLLRIIPSRGKQYGETVVIQYENPQYVPLLYNTITSIEIGIYNTHGINPIPFGSDVILKLHFRKKTI